MTISQVLDLIVPKHKLKTCVEGKAINAGQGSQNGHVDCPRCTLTALLREGDVVGQLQVAAEYEFDLTMTRRTQRQKYDEIQRLRRELERAEREL